MAQFTHSKWWRRAWRRVWRTRLNTLLAVAGMFFFAVFVTYLQMTQDNRGQDDGSFTMKVVSRGESSRGSSSGLGRRGGRGADGARRHKTQARPRELSPRAQAVVDGMRHAWGGYAKYAMGADELLPLSKKGKATLGGLGASVVDAMSTLHMMGLTEEFKTARNWVAANMTFDVDTNISFFEIVIRVLGGLVSAHQLSDDPMLLDKARDLADRLLPAFATSATGIVDSAARLPRATTGRASGAACLVEFGSDTLEFASLTALTGDDRYREGAEKGIRALHARYPDRGLLANNVERSTAAEIGSDFGIGPRGDSYYEYLLKYWLLGGRQEEHWRERWERSVDDAMARLLIQTGNASRAYAGEEHGGTKSHILPHLACWYPGKQPVASVLAAIGLNAAALGDCVVPGSECCNLALGIMSGAVSGGKARRVRDLAVKMTSTCAAMYFDFPLGLAPDTVDVDAGSGELRPHFPIYMQRPEVVESLFYMKRLTGERQYEDWAWAIWQAIEKHTRVEVGYAGVVDATQDPPVLDDIQNSWFLAETMKYLFLIFSPDSTLNLENFVLNTEAHPLRVVGGNWAGAE
eukprot:scaffold20.g7758.t1